MRLCIGKKLLFFYIVAVIGGCGVICAGVIRFVIGESVTAIIGGVRIIVITRLGNTLINYIITGTVIIIVVSG